jgi:uncharacterized protein YcfJ
MRSQNLRRLGLLAALACAAAGQGCSTMNNTERGAIGGGALGTGAGAVIGAAAAHHPLAGAAIGAVAGTAIGALAGNQADKEENRQREVAQAQMLADAQYQRQRMGIADVLTMTKEGQDPQIIINQIRKTQSTFDLTVNDLSMLKANGVADGVIAEMQAARPSAPSRVVVRQPRTVIYESGPVFVPPPYYYGPPRPVVVVGGYRHW